MGGGQRVARSGVDDVVQVLALVGRGQRWQRRRDVARELELHAEVGPEQEARLPGPEESETGSYVDGLHVRGARLGRPRAGIGDGALQRLMAERCAEEEGA